MKKVNFSIEGMSCGHCEKAVTNALLAIDGVSECAADAKAGCAEVAFDEQKTGEDALKAAIEGVGFDVLAVD